MNFDELIQVAGVIDGDDANLLVECGIRFIGFPLRLDIHREDLSEGDAARIIRRLPDGFQPVLITYLSEAARVVEFCSALGADVVQLHGEIDVSELETIRTIAPDLSVIKSLVVGKRPNDELFRTIQACSPFVEAFITDTFDPKTGASGATGKTHAWSISRAIVERSTRPVILAGGLNPENVRQAILSVRPAGVDAHTGLEDPTGRKDRRKVQQFVAESREAFRLVRENAHSAGRVPQRPSREPSTGD